MKDFSQVIKERERSGLLRKLAIPSGDIDFLSNDYLGLSKLPFSYQGENGSTGSRVLSGNSKSIEALEKRICSTHGSEDALLFPTGFIANLGVLSCVATRNDTFIMDDLCHASLIDGALLSNAKRLKFKHNDLTDLEAKLSKAQGNLFIVVESIYSMDGTCSDLKEISKLAQRFDALLIVDEAHSCGIEIKHENIDLNESVIRIVTYGKAFGSHGAAVLCSSDLKKYFINFCRPFIYSTAPSPHQVAGISHAYDSLEENLHRIDALKSLIDYWILKKPKKLNWIESSSHIQSLMIEGNENVISLSEHLSTKGFATLPIRTPTVKPGTERIRFCLHSINTKSEIDALFNELDLWKKNV